MSRQLKLLLVLALLTLSVTPAWAQMAPPPPPGVAPPPVPPGEVMPSPVPPGVAPAWTVVPNAPQVYYAPNVGTDLFRLHNQYYYYRGGVWYRGNHFRGPWHPVRRLPRAIHRVNRAFFRGPAPW